MYQFYRFITSIVASLLIFNLYFSQFSLAATGEELKKLKDNCNIETLKTNLGVGKERIIYSTFAFARKISDVTCTDNSVKIQKLQVYEYEQSALVAKNLSPAKFYDREILLCLGKCSEYGLPVTSVNDYTRIIRFLKKGNVFFLKEKTIAGEVIALEKIRAIYSKKETAAKNSSTYYNNLLPLKNLKDSVLTIQDLVIKSPIFNLFCLTNCNREGLTPSKIDLLANKKVLTVSGFHVRSKLFIVLDIKGEGSQSPTTVIPTTSPTSTVLPTPTIAVTPIFTPTPKPTTILPVTVTPTLTPLSSTTPIVRPSNTSTPSGGNNNNACNVEFKISNYNGNDFGANVRVGSTTSISNWKLSFVMPGNFTVKRLYQSNFGKISGRTINYNSPSDFNVTVSPFRGNEGGLNLGFEGSFVGKINVPRTFIFNNVECKVKYLVSQGGANIDFVLPPLNSDYKSDLDLNKRKKGQKLVFLADMAAGEIGGANTIEESSGVGSASVVVDVDNFIARIAFSSEDLSGKAIGGTINSISKNGTVLIDFFGITKTSDNAYVLPIKASGALSANEIVNLILSGDAYISIKTDKFKNGEIGGKIFFSDFSPPTNFEVGNLIKPQNLQQAVLFLQKTTFGANDALITNLEALGYKEFVEDQLKKSKCNLLPKIKSAGNINYATYSAAWWDCILNSSDQLVQRVAFALSELFVVSQNHPLFKESEIGSWALASYYDVLVNNSTGNFRQLMEEVTLHPAMGVYLDMLGSSKENSTTGAQPNENYGRELIQLFTIGIESLNDDGSYKLTNTGQAVENYNQEVVKGFAKVFTGWTINYSGRTEFKPSKLTEVPKEAFTVPMVAVENFHSTSPKLMLNGVTIPAGVGSKETLKLALDNIFQHPSLPPFVCRHLIQRLVTSNPTGDYMQRCVSIFKNNGSGVRGDLRAVVKQIVTDSALIGNLSINNRFAGKLKEPLVALSSVFRILGGKNPSYNSILFQELISRNRIKQFILGAPTVFNFFTPFEKPSGIYGQVGLVAPEIKILDAATLIGFSEIIDEQVNLNLATNFKLNLSALEAQATDTRGLIDYLDLMLTGGSLSNEIKTKLLSKLNEISSNELKAKEALLLITSLPSFHVER
jgi:uncharacterized protein (DUF1800 family)